MTRKKCSKWLDAYCTLLFGCADSNGMGFETVHSDVSMLWAICMHYLKTDHHRTTFRIFCNITQNTTPEENSCKMFHISSPIVPFFLWKGQGHLCLKIRITFHLGRAKGRDKRGYGGEAQNGGYFCKFP